MFLKTFKSLLSSIQVSSTILKTIQYYLQKSNFVSQVKYLKSLGLLSWKFITREMSNIHVPLWEYFV